MKKTKEVKKLKKLRLFRETLQALTNSDFQKVVGDGNSQAIVSCETGACITCPTE